MTGAQTQEDEVERFGRFVLVRELRRGGMGLASLAVDTLSGRIVVVKRPALKSEADAIRFRSEMQLSRELGKHPHLVEALDVGDVDGRDYLLLEWIAGPDLEALLERAGRYGRRVPVGVAAAIVRQVCGAFEHAHGRLGFVHRDVKPANIVVSYEGVAKLIDYGGALSTYKRTQTEAGQLFGTVGYLAPELRQGFPATERSDLFALGAVFAFLLTGLPLFGTGEDEDSQEALRARLERHAGKLEEAVVTFVWRALQKDPKQRYASAAEMEKALAACATPGEVGAFVSGLFPADRELDAEYAAEWRRRFGPVTPTAEKTAAAPSRRARVWVTALVGASLLGVGGARWLAQRRPPPPVARPAPEPAAEAPVAVTPPAPAATPPSLPAATPAIAHRAPAALVLGRAQEARALLKQGKSHQARRILTDLDGDPRARAPVKLGLAELAYGEHRYEDAIALASEAVHAGARADALMLRALSEMKIARLEQAERDFDRVLAIDPKNEDAREGKRLIQLRKGTP